MIWTACCYTGPTFWPTDTMSCLRICGWTSALQKREDRSSFRTMSLHYANMDQERLVSGLWGGTVVVWELIAHKQGKEQNASDDLNCFYLFSSFPDRDQVQKCTLWHIRICLEGFLKLSMKGSLWISGAFFFFSAFFLTWCILLEMSFTHCRWVWITESECRGHLCAVLGGLLLVGALSLWSCEATGDGRGIASRGKEIRLFQSSLDPNA